GSGGPASASSLRGDELLAGERCLLEACEPEAGGPGRRRLRGLAFCGRGRGLLYGALCNGHRVRAGLVCRLAVLDRLGRGTPRRPRDLDQRVLLVLECDLAGRLAIQVDAGRAGIERRPVHLALYVSLQQALDPVPAELRVLCDDLFADAERE